MRIPDNKLVSRDRMTCLAFLLTDLLVELSSPLLQGVRLFLDGGGPQLDIDSLRLTLGSPGSGRRFFEGAAGRRVTALGPLALRYGQGSPRAIEHSFRVLRRIDVLRRTDRDLDRGDFFVLHLLSSGHGRHGKEHARSTRVIPRIEKVLRVFMATFQCNLRTNSSPAEAPP